jgi:hypothetical protein
MRNLKSIPRLGLAFALALCTNLIVQPLHAADCKPWQNGDTTIGCTDKPEMTTHALGHQPQEGEACWQRQRVRCECESSQSMGPEGSGSCGSCRWLGTEDLDVVCIPEWMAPPQ